MIPGAKRAHGTTKMPGAADSAASNEFGKTLDILVDEDLLSRSPLSHSSSVLCLEGLEFSAARFGPLVKVGFILTLEEEVDGYQAPPR